jgi:hypothetical protein
VQDTAIVMDTAADLITDPVARFKVRRRHFSWELGKLLGPRLLEADRDEQTRVQEGIRKLAEEYLTDEVRASLDVQHRVLLSIAQYGLLDDLLAASRHHREHGLAPVIADGDRYYIGFPGFRDPDRSFPDEWFDGTAQVKHLLHQTRSADVSWGRTGDGRRALVVAWDSSLPNLTGAGDPPPRVFVGNRAAARTDSSNNDAGGTAVRAEIAVDDLVAGLRRKRKPKVKFTWTTRGEGYSQPVTADDVTAAGRILHRRGPRFYLVGTYLDRSKNLGVVLNPITPRRVAGRLARALRLKR